MTSDERPWISVKDRLPTSTELKSYEVKLEVGSIEKKQYINSKLGRWYPTGFRFFVGDWTTVTHWREMK